MWVTRAYRVAQKSKLYTLLDISMTVTLGRKFAIRRSLQIPPHLNGVATLPCEIFIFKLFKTNTKIFNLQTGLETKITDDNLCTTFHAHQSLVRLSHPWKHWEGDRPKIKCWVSHTNSQFILHIFFFHHFLPLMIR